MAGNKNDWVKWVIILGGLGIGGYLIYNWLTKNSVFKAVEQAGVPGLIPGVIPAINLGDAITKPTGTITEKNVAQVSKDIGKLGASATPGNILNDPIGFVFNAVGQLPNMISAVKIGTGAPTTTPTGAPNKTALSQTEVKQAIAQMDKSYNAIPTAKINTQATKKSAALITNVLTSKTTTINKVAPVVQIQAYNTAQKVVKVGGVSKKVM